MWKITANINTIKIKTYLFFIFYYSIIIFLSLISNNNKIFTVAWKMTKNVWSKKHEAKSNLQIKTLSLFFSKYKILLRINVNVCTWNVLTENKCLDCVYIIRWCIEIRVFQTNRFMDGEETYRFRKATQIDRLRMLFLVWKTSKAVLLTKDKRKKK